MSTTAAVIPDAKKASFDLSAEVKEESVMAGVWKLLSWHPFLAIGVIIVTASMLIETFSIEVAPLMPAVRVLIAPLILMCYAVTAVHVALSKTFGFAPDSFAVVRAVLCLLAGLVPFAVIDYVIAQWRLKTREH